MAQTDGTFETPAEVVAYYARGSERGRLWYGRPRLERLRVQEILVARLPPPPAVVLDVGGGAGTHAVWLARLGYAVHLVDPVPLHVDQARGASDAQPGAPLASAEIGDARSLAFGTASADVVLLLGPLYHLQERADRLAALGEARRVLRDGGLLAAIAVCRSTRLLDGLASGQIFDDPRVFDLAAGALSTGAVSDTGDEPAGLAAAFAHRAAELEGEVEEAGFEVEGLLGIEGPGWLLQAFSDAWADEARRETLLRMSRLVEADRELLPLSAHMLVLARPTG